MPFTKDSEPWNKNKKIGLRESGKVNGYGERRKDSDVFVENSTYARHKLKERIIAQNLIDYRCDCCGMVGEWQGKKLVLILDHVNGVNNDNRIENLRFVCPNCDSQLDTYKSRNRIRRVN